MPGPLGAWRERIFPGDGKEIIVRILGVQPNFHGVTARSDGFPREWQAMSGGDGDLQFDEIKSGDLFGDRMLDLQAGVYFQKIKIEIGIDEKFDRACIGITAGARQAHRGVAHFFAQVGSHDRRWSFFNDFLMAALHGAFAFAEGNDAAVGIGENLNFHVARFEQIFFKINAPVAKTVLGFRGSIAKGGRQIAQAVYHPHAFSAAAGDGLKQDRQANVFD